MKKFLVICLSILLIMNSMIAVNAETHSDEEYAMLLKQVGVFVGTNKGFELEREATRIEGLIMLLRLLGKEDEAIASTAHHPFIDVPEWASCYVSYAYSEGLTEGVSNSVFGSTNYMTANQYFTFMLRALDYKDSAGDFVWSEAISYMKTLGFIDFREQRKYEKDIFLRGDVADLSYRLLSFQMKNGQILAEKLIDTGDLDKTTASLIDVIDGVSNDRDYEFYIDQANTGDYSGDNCGPASAVMAAKWTDEYFDITVEEARNACRSDGGWWYTNDIEDFFDENRINYAIEGYDSEQEIIEGINEGNIFLLCIEMAYISKQDAYDNPVGRFYDYGDGHFLIVKGYDHIEGELYLEVYDPNNWFKTYSNGQPKGKDRLYPADEMTEAIENWWDHYFIIFQ